MDNESPVDSDPSKSQKSLNKEKEQDLDGDILSHIVAKIRSEPFLFVLAVIILIIGLVIRATSIGSPDLRFVVTVFALLAFAVLLGYYVFQGLRLYQDGRKRQPEPDAGSTRQHITGTVEVDKISNGAQVTAVDASSEVLSYQGDIEGEIKGGEFSGTPRVAGVVLRSAESDKSEEEE